jgi:NACalpha-BTF3-like transcription factor
MYFRLRTFSHSPDAMHLANRMNLYPHLPDQIKYDFLRHAGALAKRRTTGWVRRPPENEADLALVMDAYNLSKPKARQALRILKPDQLEALRDWMSRGGL